MSMNGYKRTKKFDIKKWFKGTNLVIYIVIIIAMIMALLFVLKTVIGMHNNNKQSDSAVDESSQEESSTDSETQIETVAKNQSYYIKIGIDQHIMVIYQLDSNREFTIPVKAFYVGIGPKVKPEKTTITEKSIWRKISDRYYVHYSSRLDNAEYFSTATYFSQNEYNLNPLSYNSIGQNVTDGSIIMTAVNAKWIYENCGTKTTVEILDSIDDIDNITIEEFKKVTNDAYKDPTDEPTQTIRSSYYNNYSTTQAATNETQTGTSQTPEAGSTQVQN